MSDYVMKMSLKMFGKSTKNNDHLFNLAMCLSTMNWMIMIWVALLHYQDVNRSQRELVVVFRGLKGRESARGA
jgi:hypothetical protein